MDLSIRVIALILLRDRSRFASRHPHLSVVQIVKELLSRPNRPVSPLEAKKRDCETITTNSQATSLNFIYSLLSPTTAGKPRHH